MKFLPHLAAFGLLFASVSGMAPISKAAPINPAATDAASKAPRVVYLIRHGEKPPKEAHSPNLTPTGEERAQRIPSLFLSGNGQQARLLRPDALFATHNSASSKREVETLTPLSHTLNLPMNDSYSEDQATALAADILSGKYAGKVVVICWHHGAIPAVATALGVEDAPKWPDGVFDRIWKIEWVNGKAVMKNIPESLMPGDSGQN